MMMMMLFQESIDDGAVVMILANKVDLIDEEIIQRAVSTEAGRSLADVRIVIITRSPSVAEKLPTVLVM